MIDTGCYIRELSWNIPTQAFEARESNFVACEKLWNPFTRVYGSFECEVGVMLTIEEVLLRVEVVLGIQEGVTFRPVSCFRHN